MLDIPVFSASISNDDDGIFAMSFVDLPAIERNFVALKKGVGKPIKLALNKKKQVLTGPVLIPDKLIYRNDSVGEYYITFSADDIEKISRKMMSDGIALYNTTHNHEVDLAGNFLVELWIVEDPKRDKSNAVGLGEFPKGTLMASYLVQDKDYWEKEVVTENVRGFSLEGIFNLINIKMKKKKTNSGVVSGLASFFKSMTAILETDTQDETKQLEEEAGKDETGSGEPYLIFTLENGAEMYVDKDGFCTLDGEQMPPGDHILEDGNVVVVDDNGALVITQPEGAGDTSVSAEMKAAAKKRAAAYLAAIADPKASEIAKLKKQIELLKKSPSTGKAKPKSEPVDVSKMSRTEKLAAILKSQRERKGK